MSNCPQKNDVPIQFVPIFKSSEDADQIDADWLDDVFGFSDYLEDSDSEDRPFTWLNDAESGAHDENGECNLECSDNNLCTCSSLSLETDDIPGDAFWPSSIFACSSGSLENEPLFLSVETIDSPKIPDAQNSGSFLIGSSTSVDSFLCTSGSTCDLDVEDKPANCSSQKHASIPIRNHIVACSVWCNDDDDKMLSSKADTDIPPAKRPKQSSKRDGDESLNSKASKRHIRSKAKRTLKQIDADTAPAKRPKQSSKRNGDKRVTSKAGKRRFRSKSKKTLARAAKQPKKTSKRSIRKWTKEEDARLEEGVKLFKIPHWSLIANHVKTRTNKMCAQRWRYALRPENKSINKGTWSKEEDQSLRRVASKYEIKNERAWDMISESMGFTRSNIQCRERWINFLDPTLNLGPWTTEEDARLRSLYKECGNCWKKFTSEFVGRSAMHIRRRFENVVRRRSGGQRRRRLRKSAYLK